MFDATALDKNQLLAYAVMVFGGDELIPIFTRHRWDGG